MMILKSKKRARQIEQDKDKVEEEKKAKVEEEKKAKEKKEGDAKRAAERAKANLNSSDDPSLEMENPGA